MRQRNDTYRRTLESRKSFICMQIGCLQAKILSNPSRTREYQARLRDKETERREVEEILARH